MIKVLIIDDDRTVCSSLELLLTRNKYSVDKIHQPQLAMDTIQHFDPELIILDMNFSIDTSGKQGMRLLKMIREAHPQISIILMTGWATVQLAVEGMKLGARDFIAKPWDNKSLLSSINNIIQLHHTGTKLERTNTKNDSTIIGESDEIINVLNLVEKVGKTEASVLITGESGTGKELIAEVIHNVSNRHNDPFVKVNLGGIPNALFESELFGHKKGAFTGAHTDRDGRFLKAEGGTIFLDEIGELSLESQVKMLRVLQEKTYEILGSSNTIRTDVRLVSATNRNLVDMVNNGQFREDLFYRINLLHIHLPPLRERRADISLLINYFINNLVNLYNTDHPYIDENTMTWLSMQDYKGNIRQLKNIVERTFLLNLGKKDLKRKDFEQGFGFESSLNNNTVSLNLQQMEINLIKKALAKHNYSISSASKALGITRSSLYRRLEKYQIPHEPEI